MIRDEDLELIRQSVTMKELASRYGYRPDRSGKICCPFHKNDRHPSMQLYEGTRGYFCFTCQSGGNIINFVMKHDGLAFEPAVRRIAEMFSIPISDGKTEISASDRKKISAKKAQREAAENARKAVQNKLNMTADKILTYEWWVRHFRPFGAVWCGFQALLVSKKAEWEYWWEKDKQSGK